MAKMQPTATMQPSVPQSHYAANFRLTSILVTPERKGEQLVGVREALEPLDRDEPVHAFEFAPEPSGLFQIIVLAAIGRENFEDDSDHGHLSFAVEHLGSNKMLSGPFRGA